MATMYRSTDIGAPGWTTHASYKNAESMMRIIKTCLVDGYGSKDPAGWTLIYEDTTVDKYRMAVSNGNGVIEFVTWGANGIAVFIWDEITTPGAGRLGAESWETVVSTGVNGLSSNGNPLPGTSANQVAGIYSRYFESSIGASDWTIFADARSFWLAMAYPDGDSNAAPGANFRVSGNYQAQLFAGAVKSADLAADDAGNFFVLHGGRAAGTTATPAAGVNLMSYTPQVFGLRTPTGIIPGADLALRSYTIPQQFTANPYSSVRAILPYVLTYDGPDKPASAGIGASYDEYAFATIPGIGKFADLTSSDNFWAYYTALHADTWFHELQEFGGAQWMPYGLATNGNDGLTTDDAWWT